MAVFTGAFHNLLKDEGGFSNHPQDGGGATQWGVTHDELSRWRGYPVSEEDVKGLTLPEAEEIYKAWYWDTLNLDLVKSQLVGELLFNFGVNMGVVTIAKMAQDILGVVKDGKVGPKTLSAINSSTEDFPKNLFKAVQIRYVRIVKNNPSQLVFLEGWINRTHRFLAWL